jgi:16S rRNA (guanine(966)-N(2))-methyltransferase RsmD
MAARIPRRHDLTFTVIAGELKGRRICAPDLGVTRPPLTRLRRSIFDFLNPYVELARYLDLFSGTGSYLFEAVSRGASRAVGIEAEPELTDAINRHAREFGVSDRLECRCRNVFEAIPRMAQAGECFEIVMMAPPQYKGLVSATLATMRQHRVAADGALIICQHDTSETERIDWADFPIAQQRRYGNTTFTVLRAASAR